MTTASPALGVWLYDIRRGTIWANKAFAELYSLDVDAARRGIPRLEILAKVHPDDVDRVRSHFDEAIAKAGSYSESYQLYLHDKGGRFVLDQGDHLLRGGRTVFCGTSVELDPDRLADLHRGRPCLDEIADHCLNARKIADQMGLKIERHLLDMTLIEVGQKLAAATKRRLLDWH